jgi:hypothetical protein
MKLKVGLTFTGAVLCFTGRIEVLEIDEPNNRLRVGLTKNNGTFFSNWNEDWDLQVVLWGFELDTYYIKDFTNSEYPQDVQSRLQKV